jgi:transcriptional regulator with PAS, ATPase and Fis domain
VKPLRRFVKVLAQVAKVASTDSTVLISTGTRKKLLARAILNPAELVACNVENDIGVPH